MELIFATHNEDKVKEVQAMMPNYVTLLSLNDVNYKEDIEEIGTSLEENARIKAETIYEKTGKNVFADDSGLFVEMLNGAPGVYSARYSGTNSMVDNVSKLLLEMDGYEDRRAYFEAVICLIFDGQAQFFSGKINGRILDEVKGDGGFGYDPLFVPDGYESTFAQMLPEKKNQISHRSKAVQKLIDFLEIEKKIVP